MAHIGLLQAELKVDKWSNNTTSLGHSSSHSRYRKIPTFHIFKYLIFYYLKLGVRFLLEYFF